MSSDLLAEFGAPSPTPQPAQPQRFELFDRLAGQGAGPSTDDWGDFEAASAPPAPASASINTQPDPSAPSAAAVPPPGRPAAIPQHDPFDLAPWEAPRAPRGVSAPRDPNVLFDADDDGEDDFGDFEGTPAVEQAAPPRPTPPTTVPLNIDRLLGELDVSDGLSSKAPSSRQSDWKTNTTAKFAARSTSESSFVESPAIRHTNKRPAKPPTQQAPSNPLDIDDDWADFTGSPAVPVIPSASTGLQISQTPSIPDPAPNALPPTNIPPPARLLTLFPPVFSSAQTSLLRPLSTQPAHMRGKILADDATIRFLRAYLAVGVVAARVMAGRKLRWKRDGFLAQGMRIGPAGKAGAGGMKLTAIDRAESSKEDREAADVVRAWREQVGRLRAVAAQVNSSAASRARGVGSVPEMAETMAIRTATEVEGGIAARRPCGLCGLRRNERVGKVDVEVEDSFGEWWVDGVSMHRACRNFWEEHKGKLR